MNPESVLFEQLSILDQVYRNPIDIQNADNVDVYPYLKQWLDETLPSLRTPLQKHQYDMVIAMMAHTIRMLRGFQWDNQLVQGKLGIVGDPPGSGKTLSVLAFLAAMQRIDQYSSNSNSSNSSNSSNIDMSSNISSTNAVRFGDVDSHSNRYFHSKEILEVSDTSACNLLIVPQILLEHWKQETATHTTLQPFIVDSRRVLRNQSTAERMVQSSFVLVTNRTYSATLDYAETHRIRWKQLFFDDATHILLTNTDSLPRFDFAWLIAADWMSFIHKNTHFHASNLLYARDRMELTTDCVDWMNRVIGQNGIAQTRVESSNFFKSLVPYAHPCRAALVLRNAASQWPSPTDVHELTFSCASNLTYSQLTPAFLASRQDLGTLIPSVFHSLGLEAWTPENLCAHHGDRAALLHRKLEDDCSICLEPTRNRVLLSCCLGSFCGECILRQLVTRAESNCPTCRAPLYLPQFLHVPRLEGSTAPISFPLTKQQRALEYIQEHATDSIILYSSYMNTFYQLQPLLQQKGISCELLSMPLNRFHHTLRGYQEGRIRVLFVNDANLVHGLNLQRTAHLLFFYAPAFYDTQQTLMNAALRQGRTGPLTVVRLSTVFE